MIRIDHFVMVLFFIIINSWSVLKRFARSILVLVHHALTLDRT